MTRARVRLILLLALAMGVLVDVVGPGNAPGVNVPIVMAAFLGAAFLVAGRDGIRRMDPADAWLAPAAVALASFAAVRADDWLVLWDLAFAAALAGGTIACLGGARITRGLVPRVLETAAGVVAAAGAGVVALLVGSPPGSARHPGESFDVAPGAAPAAPAGPSRARRLATAARRATPVARGLLLALPLVIVFTALFALADAVFARFAGDVLAWRPDIDLADAMERSVIVGFTAWAVAGLLGLGAGLLPAFLPRASGDAEPVLPPFGGARSLGAASAADLRAVPRRGMGAAEATTVLVVVDLLFAAFVGLQLAYLFGGRDTLATAGLTYAAYARRGFFELVLVALLAGMLVVTLDLAVPRRSRVQLGAALALVTLTAVVLASALLRLRLYQEAYGWTELRFVVLVTIGWLAVALAVAAGLLVTRRTRWTLHVLGILVLVTLLGMNAVGPQGFVAERNLERAIDLSLVPPGGRVGLDASYLVTLGDDAVPAVVAALPLLAPSDRLALEPFLLGRQAALRTDPAMQGWPSWNLARARARDSLAGRAVGAAALQRP